MRKPDIFDEIIRCLADSEVFNPDTSLNPEVQKAFFGGVAAKKAHVVPEPPVQTIRIAKTMKQEAAPAPAVASMPDVPPFSSASAVPNAAAAPSVPDLNEIASAGMDELRAMTMSCRGCGLCQTRTNVVFCDGNPEAKLMFIGEGPGADEDAQGVPFVGRAGELLTRMIAAMTFDRATETYIANIVKCRPPGNRNPNDEEAAACIPYLKRQIELVQPRVIVLLGAVPLLYLMGMKGISKLRGSWLYYDGIKVMPTYHPAFLLRNPPAKKDVWQDLQIVMAEFGRKPVSPAARS